MLADPPPNPFVTRVAAAQATLDRYKDQPFEWGRFDCARMVAHLLRQAGYKPNLSAGGAYRSLLGAKRALKKAGYETLAEGLDALGLERIAPAAAVTGDIIEWPSENELAALGVALGNGRMVAYHPDAAGACVLQPVEFVAAWRVEFSA
jgi:hypothetical protein